MQFWRLVTPSGMLYHTMDAVVEKRKASSFKLQVCQFAISHARHVECVSMNCHALVLMEVSGQGTLCKHVPLVCKIVYNISL